jgi:hypothetical protein
MKYNLNIRINCCLLVLLSAVPVVAQTEPNTFSLSCWDTRRGGTFQSRQAKTPVVKSSGGSAYAETVAQASTNAGQAQFCKNTVRLFYAKDDGKYNLVYEKAGLEDQGVGIRIAGWSHSGTQLLIEVGAWGYDRDSEVTKSALALDADTGQVRELPLPDAFERALGKDCEFDSSVVGWGVDDSVLVRIGKTPPTTRYQQTFCVEKPTLYSFKCKAESCSAMGVNRR